MDSLNAQGDMRPCRPKGKYVKSENSFIYKRMVKGQDFYKETLSNIRTLCSYFCHCIKLRNGELA